MMSVRICAKYLQNNYKYTYSVILVTALVFSALMVSDSQWMIVDDR